MRASLLRAEVTSNLAVQLLSAFDAFGPAGAAINRRYAVDHKEIRVANVGMNYDPGTWFLMAEASRTRTDSLFGASRSAYVSAGWRWNAWTPYATLAHVRDAGDSTDPGLPLASLPAAARPAAAALNAGLNALLATIPRQTSQSAGLRWDLLPNTALKLQYDRVTTHGGSRGTLINTQPGFQPGRTVHVASLALDFVY